MRTALRLVWLFTLAVAACSAQVPDIDYTHGLLNGRYWLTLQDTRRVFWIGGYSEGWTVYGSKDYPNHFPVSAPYGDIVKGLDQFYSEAENLAIPIAHAIAVFSLKVSGTAKAADVEAAILKFRQMAIKPDDPPKR